MRSLHIACLPYPSPQGTQALIHRQLSALASAGDDVHLLTYSSRKAHGDGQQRSYSHRRCGGEGVSLRSGPSLQKAYADLAMVPGLRRAASELNPDVLVGHNVEGAVVVHLSRLRLPHVYMAHTRMDTELPTYVSPWLRRAAAWTGSALDWVSAHADHVAAVSPWLATRFHGTYVPPPWELPAPIEAEERGAARRELGLHGAVGVYAGNLDAYQDWRQILELRELLTLVVATASDASALVGQVEHVLPLQDEGDRRRIHAIADMALVPRGASGGLPIKLIDALSRGVPVVASRSALAGLSPDGVRVGSTLADALPVGELHRAIGELKRARDLNVGRRWVAANANDAEFVRAMHKAARIAIDKRARSVEKWR